MGRRQVGVNTLGFVAMVMCLFNPHWLWDAGFQLSFFATLGLILYADPLQAWAVRWLERLTAARPGLARQLVEGWGDGLIFTLAAQITTLPLLAYYFGRVSLVAFAANPLVLPAQPPLMILGGLAALLGSAALPLGQPFAWLAWPFLAYTIRTAELFGSLAPAVRVPLAPAGSGAASGPLTAGLLTAGLLTAYYALLFGLTWLPRAWPQAFSQALAHARACLAAWTGGWRPNTALAVLAAAACLVWRAAASAPDGRLHITLLDEGATPSTLVQTPTGRFLLVSGGGLGDGLSDSLGRRLPLIRPELDLLIVTPGGSAGFDGLDSLVGRIPARQVVWIAPVGTSRAAQRLQDSLRSAGTDVQAAQAGQTFDLGGGARLTLLSAGTEGACLLVEWNSFRLLMAPEGCAGLPAGPVSVLVVGGADEEEDGFAGRLADLRPQVILAGNAGAGSELLAANASARGHTILSTAQNGWIQITTDGGQMWVETETK